MTVCARFAAWLHATLRSPAEPNATDAKRQQPTTRYKQMKAQGVSIVTPPNQVPAIFDWLMAVGPVEMSGGARASLSPTTIVYWQIMSEVHLLPWQSAMLRMLSREYLDELTEAEDPVRPAPWQPEAEETPVVSKEQALRAFLGMH